MGTSAMLNLQYHLYIYSVLLFPCSHALRGNTYPTRARNRTYTHAKTGQALKAMLGQEHMFADVYAFPRRAWERENKR